MAPFELTSPENRSKRLLTFWVFLVSLGVGVWVTFAKLGVQRMGHDESIYALVTENLLRSGDPFSLSIYPPQPYLAKPPLYMWLSAVTYHWLPGLEFKYRFWSALCAALAIGLTAVLGAKLFRPEIGLLAAALLAMNREFLFNHGARNGGMDSGLTVTLTAILLIYSLGRRGRWKAWKLGLSLGLMAGIASLFKPMAGLPMLLLVAAHAALATFFGWLLGVGQPVPPSGEQGANAAPFRLGWARSMVLTLCAAGLCIVIGTPYYIWQFIRLGRTLMADLLDRELTARIAGEGPATWNQPWHYFLTQIPQSQTFFALVLPAVVWLFLVLIVRAARRRGRRDDPAGGFPIAIQSAAALPTSIAETDQPKQRSGFESASAAGLLLIVAVGWIGGLSYSRGKFLHYAYPVFPVLSIAIAGMLMHLVGSIIHRFGQRFSASAQSVPAFVRWSTAWLFVILAGQVALVVVPKQVQPLPLWTLYRTFEPAIRDHRMDLIFAGVGHRQDTGSDQLRIRPAWMVYGVKMVNPQEVSTPAELAARVATGKPALIVSRCDGEWNADLQSAGWLGHASPLYSDRRPPIMVTTVNLDPLLKVEWKPGKSKRPTGITVTTPHLLATQPTDNVVGGPLVIQGKLDFNLGVPLVEAARVTIALNPPTGQPPRSFNWVVTSDGDIYEAGEMLFAGPTSFDFSLSRFTTKKHRERSISIRLVPLDNSGPIGAEVTRIGVQSLPEVVPGQDGHDWK